MRYEVAANIGKVRVAVTLGNKYCVWNGKQGPGEFRIACKDKRQATQLAQQINQLRGKGTVEVD
jgi:hypothetical protein